MQILGKEPKNIKPVKHDKVYFVERTNDGKIFTMNEKEVQRRFYENTSIYRWNFKILGVSDGKTMEKYMKENKKDVRELENKKDTLEDRLDRYVEKEDELLFEEMVEDDDPRLQRLQKRKEQTKAKIRDLIKKINDESGEVWKEAFEAEKQVAIENGPSLPEPPSEIIHSKRSSESDRKKIERALGNR